MGALLAGIIGTTTLYGLKDGEQKVAFYALQAHEHYHAGIYAHLHQAESEHDQWESFAKQKLDFLSLGLESRLDQPGLFVDFFQLLKWQELREWQGDTASLSHDYALGLYSYALCSSGRSDRYCREYRIHGAIGPSISAPKVLARGIITLSLSSELGLSKEPHKYRAFLQIGPHIAYAFKILHTFESTNSVGWSARWAYSTEPRGLWRFENRINWAPPRAESAHTFGIFRLLQIRHRLVPEIKTSEFGFNYGTYF